MKKHIATLLRGECIIRQNRLWVQSNTSSIISAFLLLQPRICTGKNHLIKRSPEIKLECVHRTQKDTVDEGIRLYMSPAGDIQSWAPLVALGLSVCVHSFFFSSNRFTPKYL